MLAFLAINNIEIDVLNDIIEEVMVEIATDKMNKKQLTDWLKQQKKT